MPFVVLAELRAGFAHGCLAPCASYWLQHPRHSASQLLPLGLLSRELLAAPRRQSIHPHLSATLVRLPSGSDAAVFLQTRERWIERAVFDEQDVLRRALDVPGDSVPVTRAEEQGSENQQIEGPWQKSGASRISGHSR